MAPDTRTRGQRWADAVTSFGGSWLFIGTFLFLNMLLTVISTFQQPFVLLSQNRQNEEDRQRDEEDPTDHGVDLNTQEDRWPASQPPQSCPRSYH